MHQPGCSTLSHYRVRTSVMIPTDSMKSYVNVLCFPDRILAKILEPRAPRFVIELLHSPLLLWPGKFYTRSLPTYRLRRFNHDVLNAELRNFWCLKNLPRFRIENRPGSLLNPTRGILTGIVQFTYPNTQTSYVKNYARFNIAHTILFSTICIKGRKLSSTEPRRQ